jgi:hypothetical protein
MLSQSVHAWISRYEQGGLAALADRSHRPSARPHQISAELEARICEPGAPRVETQEDLSPARQAGRRAGARALEHYRCLRRHGYQESRCSVGQAS